MADARSRREVIRLLADARRRLAAAEAVLDEAHATRKRAEEAYDAAGDRFDAAEAALDVAREHCARARGERYAARQVHERAGEAVARVQRRASELAAHAASKWVFASLYTQPLEATAIRALIRDRLALPGAPQMLLQLGPAHTTHATARRPPADLIEP
jgi:hypothetical protein